MTSPFRQNIAIRINNYLTAANKTAIDGESGNLPFYFAIEQFVDDVKSVYLSRNLGKYTAHFGGGIDFYYLQVLDHPIENWECGSYATLRVSYDLEFSPLSPIIAGEVRKVLPIEVKCSGITITQLRTQNELVDFLEALLNGIEECEDILTLFENLNLISILFGIKPDSRYRNPVPSEEAVKLYLELQAVGVQPHPEYSCE